MVVTSTPTTLSPSPSSKMISVRSPLSETMRDTSVIVVSTPSAPTNTRSSGIVVGGVLVDVVVAGGRVVVASGSVTVVVV